MSRGRRAGDASLSRGGNTSCVELQGGDGTVLVLDAGTGIRRLGRKLAAGVERVDILLTHLHMDHIQGLGFFAPLFQPMREVHVWGPPGTMQSLAERLARYLSPPLFPVHLREVASQLHLHDPTGDDIRIGRFHIEVAFVCHPNPTVGYRITDGQSTVTHFSRCSNPLRSRADPCDDSQHHRRGGGFVPPGVPGPVVGADLELDGRQVQPPARR